MIHTIIDEHLNYYCRTIFESQFFFFQRLGDKKYIILYQKQLLLSTLLRT